MNLIVTDNMRNRIADAIAAAGEQPDADVLSMADAVIAELGLRREELGGFRVPGFGHRGHRYVTAWMSNE